MFHIGASLAPSKDAKYEIRLDPVRTNGTHARVVFVTDKLRKEIESYLKSINIKFIEQPVFRIRKRTALSASTLCRRQIASIAELELTEPQATPVAADP